MSSFSELTEQHLEMDYLMSDLRESLKAAHVHGQSLEMQGGSLYRVAQLCMRLKRELARQYYVVDANLIGRASRILGGQLEEAAAVSATFDHLMDAIDELLEELPSFPNTPLPPQSSRLVYTQILCDEIDVLFERHMASLRAFYQGYSTLLFPGGAVAE